MTTIACRYFPSTPGTTGAWDGLALWVSVLDVLRSRAIAFNSVGPRILLTHRFHYLVS